MPAQHLLTKIADTAGAVRVMNRSGLVPFPRVDQGIRSLLAVRKYGPFAGPVHAHAEARLDAVALIDERGPLTYIDIDEQSNALVRAWQAEGITPGSAMGCMCRNHRGLVLTMLAAAKNGTRLVLMNTGFARPQLVDVAAREQIEAFVYDDEFRRVAEALPDEVISYRSWAEDGSASQVRTLDDLIDGVDRGPVPAPSTEGGFVLLTSGTTGTPKGAPRGHTSPLASAQFLDRVPLRRGQTMMMAAPAFHGTGVSQFALALALGQTVVMHRKFDPENTIRLLEKHRCDVLVVVPTMLQRIIDLGPDTLSKYDTSSLTIIFAAGSSLSPDLCKRTTAAFGHVLHNLYGSTEVAVATVATPADLALAPGTAGRPPVTCHVELYDEAGQRITEPETVGRIFVASGLSFSGYTDGRDKERINGLLSTGDVGHFDRNGLLFVDGRDDDMIVSGGENVYPLEVENLLADREDVIEAAVIGVEDADFGHRLRAFVVPAPGSAKDAEEMKAYIKSNLARYKVPRDIVFIDELPRNATGKLLRRALIEMEP
ncbi:MULTISPECIES: acyl-CoA synthetase [Rhodococcus]|uniref:Acyl-CoA synthetase n=1 Tax=Rhodococcus oxybenzonivorans TaxID=1990687 RepID=A0AAE4UXG8_9NOCA|nr:MULTISPECIES: acyl-CoA synthetase [Rhodococcus]MDV7244678.1 acyl-CoA synthetase [Rhodococcus oxybenzonivorans]MDV7264048.1 acyl-CoA synthetase [Rhodococcus oxybenzonivorans]MDV7275823.1 acyl-CoA synthetase [Rhodococcus oxybenzonivorans]MDV7332600.1 acyl-CoA synthetase [Rhodococcus oxybenzonivorans]MDV7346396.1 acyl-CoA synthetase [Rhodococcus oxybenzonivorans]